MQFLTNIDLVQNELWNVRLQQLPGTSPSSPVEGQIWWDSSNHAFKYYDGGAVQIVGTSSAAGTVTSASVVSENGFAGTVATATTTPAITLKTTVTGILLGDGTGVSPAVAGTDFAAPTSGTSILKGNGSGGFSSASAGTDYLAPSGNGSALTGLTQSQVSGLVTALAALAPLASAALTGAPTAPTPTTSTGIATKGYVDSVAQGLDSKPSAAAVATANITLSGTQTVDGVALTAGMRALATAQSTASQNGLWVVASGSWTRPADFAAASTQVGTYVFVEGGTAKAASGWVLAGTTAVTVDTTSQTWTQFNQAAETEAGAGLSQDGNTISVENSGVLTVTHGGTGAATLTGLVKAGGTSAMTAAVSGTDYAPATGDGTLILKGNGSGGFAPAKYATVIGDGSTTSIAVVHDLGTQDVIVQIYDHTSFVQYECDVTRTSDSTVTLGFATAPGTDAINVVVIG